MENRIEYTKDRVMTGVICESSGEYSLPDYNGDIKKILHVGTSVIPSGKFLDGDSGEFSGIISYDVVYLDGENNVTHLGFTTDYEMAVRCSGDRFMEADIDTSIDNYNLRPVGPRKLSAKAVLSSTAHIMEREELIYEGDTFTEGEPEVLTEEARVRTCFFDRSGEREWAEELEHLEGVIADEVEILFTGCDVKIDEREISQSGGSHCGELTVFSLVKCGSEAPYRIEKTIPFKDSFFTSGELPEPFNAGESFVLSDVTVTSLGASVNAEEDGSSIAVSVITEGKMRVSTNTPVMLVRDCYLTECKTENEKEELVYSELVGAVARTEKFVSELDRAAAGAQEVRNFILASARARVNSTEVMENSLKIGGELRFSGIACEVSETGEVSYSNMKIDVPFEQKVNVGCHIPKGARAECDVSATSAALSVEGDSLVASAVLDIAASVVSDKRASYVCTSLKCEERYESDPVLLTVYYPEPDETLFDIAKKFHKSQISVAATNSITENVFADKTSPLTSLGVKKVIIK